MIFQEDVDMQNSLDPIIKNAKLQAKNMGMTRLSFLTMMEITVFPESTMDVAQNGMEKS